MKQSLISRLLTLYSQTPRIAILMSGTGSNADVILRNAERYKNLNFVTLCTDSKTSNALNLSEKYGLKYFCLDEKIKTLAERENYFQKLAEYLHELKIDTLIYAGFMKISADFFVKKFPGINVHPADLTILDSSGKPKYVGMNVIRAALEGGETYLASTAHVVDCEVDCGTPILVSKHMDLADVPSKDLSYLHEQMKIHCEHVMYPLLLELLSQGRILQTELPYKWGDLSPRH